MLGVLNHLWVFQAISELNIKAKSWKDLLTDEPFTRKDILHIQDPLNFQNKVIRDFEHMKKQLTTDDPSEEDGASLRNVSDDTRRVLETLGTSTAKAAFESGGGGKAMEARRILAAEKNKKAVQKDTDGKPKSTVGSGGRSQCIPPWCSITSGNCIGMLSFMHFFKFQICLHLGSLVFLNQFL